MDQARSPRNKTLTLDATERDRLRRDLLTIRGGVLVGAGGGEAIPGPWPLAQVENRVIQGDMVESLGRLPRGVADLLILDPPYNLTKDFDGWGFSRRDDEAYLAYLRSWFPAILETLSPRGSVYLCGDWQASGPLYTVMREHLVLRNRITWQREKGRGARANWKNASEDIWFGTRGADYWFDLEAVKQKRRVLAPYRHEGQPKDWVEEGEGRFRLTHPGNCWDDLTVPYWSMAENTDHPTQKPEKLLAKLILASCPPGGLVIDPFLGSGTTAVTARKLGRRFVGIEQQETYCLWALKRLARAETDRRIQGYDDGVFWERNSGGSRSRS